MLKRGDTVWDHSPNRQPDSAFFGVLQHISGEWVSYSHERGITHVERRYVCSSPVAHAGEKCKFCGYERGEVPVTDQH